MPWLNSLGQETGFYAELGTPEYEEHKRSPLGPDMTEWIIDVPLDKSGQESTVYALFTWGDDGFPEASLALIDTKGIDPRLRFKRAPGGLAVETQVVII